MKLFDSVYIDVSTMQLINCKKSVVALLKINLHFFIDKLYWLSMDLFLNLIPITNILSFLMLLIIIYPNI